jgi:hypothetical protein
VYKGAHGSIIHHSLRLETTKMPINNRMRKQIAFMQLKENSKKILKKTIAICNSMYKFHKNTIVPKNRIIFDMKSMSR